MGLDLLKNLSTFLCSSACMLLFPDAVGSWDIAGWDSARSCLTGLTPGQSWLLSGDCCVVHCVDGKVFLLDLMHEMHN